MISTQRDPREEETDLDIAIERLTAWIRDYGDSKEPVFIGDLSMVVLAARDHRNLTAKLDTFQCEEINVIATIGDQRCLARTSNGSPWAMPCVLDREHDGPCSAYIPHALTGQQSDEDKS